MILNLDSGGRTKTVAAGKVDFVVSNPLTDRIYMGTRTGLLQCVREIHQKYPLLHIDETALAVAEDEQEDQNVDKPANGPVAPVGNPMPPVVPPNNPFGGNKPPANNPFAPGNNGGANNPPANNQFAPGNNGGGNAPPKNPFQN